jgi:DNA-damage-inducible protein J
MAIKSANVTARVEPEIKNRAEEILSSLGISASTAINMFYRQIVLWNGMPFRASIPTNRPLARDEMTNEEFNARMAIGLTQAKANQSAPADEVFDRLIRELTNE